MHVDRFTPDHALVVQAAYAYRNDAPAYAETLLRRADNPLRAALELVGLLVSEREDRLAKAEAGS